MKKIILFLFLGFLMVGCIQSPGPNDTINKGSKEYVYVDVDDYVHTIPIYKFEYDGHKYIQFDINAYKTILHDPNCKCHIMNNNNDFNSLFNY